MTLRQYKCENKQLFLCKIDFSFDRGLSHFIAELNIWEKENIFQHITHLAVFDHLDALLNDI